MVDLTGQNRTGFPLIETKLYAPRRRPGHVSRPHLVERLEQGATGRLILMSAPPGFGKTTLLAEWLAASASRERLVAWVSLDPGDNDPVVFWTYIVTALRRSVPGTGTDALAMLQSRQPPLEPVITTMINDIAAIDRDVALILDDLHVIDNRSVHRSLAFLLDHLPPRMHLVIASRADPPLPLARLRGRHDATELRAADLRFTPDETAAFLNDTMGLRLAAGEVDALETRTEGWIAGIQIAALSMQGRADTTGFIREFSGDHRYIVDFLVEEVLHRADDDTRSFLLQTSILDRLNGALCDAVTGRTDGREMIADLERRNMFVVPLDDTRDWYRYHHLFADVLRAHAMEEQAARIPSLHRRAAAWFERHGMPSEAIEQARAAGDHDAVARLLAANRDEFRRLGRNASITRWAASLPDEMVRARPRLALIFAASAMASDNTNRTARQLASWAGDAIRAIEDRGGLDPGEDADGTIVGPGGLDALKGELLALRIMHAFRNLPPEEITATADQALALLPDTMHRDRVLLRMTRVANSMKQHSLESGLPDLELCLEDARKANSPALMASVLTFQGEVHVDLGHLQEGRRSYEAALKAGQEASAEATLEMVGVHTGLAEVLLELGELPSATHHAARALDIASIAPTRSPVLYARTTAAQVMAAAGDTEAALAQLEEANAFVRGSSDARFHSHLAAVALTIHCRTGNLDAAGEVVQARGLTPDLEIDTSNADEAIAYARFLISGHGDGDPALQVLTRVLPVIQARGRVRDEIRARVLQALGLALAGDQALALASLGRATMLGEPGGFNRVFAAEGPAMVALLESLVDAVRRGPAPAASGSSHYLSWLLREARRTTPTPARPASLAPLPEPLTHREIEVLQLIADGLRNQEIADRLYISLPTVKRHIANAYGKLGVRHRTEAVARLQQLGLL